MESGGGPRAAVIPLYNSVSLIDLLCTLYVPVAMEPNYYARIGC